MCIISHVLHTLRNQIKYTLWVSSVIQNDVYSLKLSTIPRRVVSVVLFLNTAFETFINIDNKNLNNNTIGG
jgi:hypothetical protein